MDRSALVVGNACLLPGVLARRATIHVRAASCWPAISSRLRVGSTLTPFSWLTPPRLAFSLRSTRANPPPSGEGEETAVSAHSQAGEGKARQRETTFALQGRVITPKPW